MERIVYTSQEDVVYAFESLINQKEAFEMKLLTRDIIKSSELVLYGAGNMGLAAVQWLQYYGLKIKYLIDSNEEKRGTFIAGCPVINPKDIPDTDKDQCLFLVCVVTAPYSDMYSLLSELGCKIVYPAWDIIDLFNRYNKILCGWSCADIADEDLTSCKKVFTVLADDISKAHYFQALSWRIHRKEVFISYAPILRDNKYFPIDIPINLITDEVFVDCGAYNGNTLDTFIKRTEGKFKSIYAFEPSTEGFAALNEFISNNKLANRTELYQIGLGSRDENVFFNDSMGDECHFTSEKKDTSKQRLKLDTILKEKDFTYIKVHAEGDDFDIIIGGINVISKQRPIIAITTFHNRNDFFNIPDFFITHLLNYSFYFRAYCYCGIETVLYAVPNERKRKER